jgi:hypothetical protein
MKSFKQYITESKNTLVADVNEIYFGYLLNNKVWFDKDAEKQYEQRLTQITDQQAEMAKGHAEAMTIEFIRWAKQQGYSGIVKKIWWTARPGSMSAAVGQPVDQKKNPTDILVQFTSGPVNGFLGVSAKATKTKGDIGFKNPGIGTVDRSLSLNLSDYVKQETDAFVAQHDLPSSTNERKKSIRADQMMVATANQKGSEILAQLRDKMLVKLQTKNSEQLKQYLLSDWMDANILYPPYVKVTGQGSRAPYKAIAEDPLKNPKLQALSTGDISLIKVGNESIGVVSGGKNIMKIRFKFESQKMASSVKLSGDPWK